MIYSCPVCGSMMEYNPKSDWTLCRAANHEFGINFLSGSSISFTSENIRIWYYPNPDNPYCLSPRVEIFMYNEDGYDFFDSEDIEFKSISEFLAYHKGIKESLIFV
jgi:hypothetical protein